MYSNVTFPSSISNILSFDIATQNEYLPIYSITFSGLPFGGSIYVIHVLSYNGFKNLLNSLVFFKYSNYFGNFKSDDFVTVQSREVKCSINPYKYRGKSS